MHLSCNPMPPGCNPRPRLQPDADAGWNSRLEWLLLMPRAHAATILRTVNLFETCTPKQPSCCAISRSEDLLEVCHSKVSHSKVSRG